MKISLILPVYNVESYLAECLHSLIKQDIDDYEIICIDDKSPDNSIKILEQYRESCSKIKIIRNKKNMGLSTSRNIGLRAARGKYILFVDSDDYIKPNILGKLYERMEKDKLDILYFNKKSFTDNENIVAKKIYNKKFGESEILNGRQMFTKYMLNWSFKSMNAYTQFFRTNFLRDNNLYFYDGLVHEDYLFFFNAAMKAKRVGNMDKVLYYYRVRSDSITGTVTPLRKQSMFVSLMEVVNYWKNNSFSEEENKAIENFCTVLHRGCEEYRIQTNGRDELLLSDSTNKFLYRNIMNSKYVYITEKEWNKVKKAKRVWLYGAGKVANELIRMMVDRGITIQGVLVTADDGTLFYGWKKISIDTVDFTDEDLIIISTAGKYKKEMEQKLKSLHVKKYICAAKKATF